jgi:hypothetical protein
MDNIEYYSCIIIKYNGANKMLLLSAFIKKCVHEKQMNAFISQVFTKENTVADQSRSRGLWKTQVWKSLYCIINRTTKTCTEFCILK